MPGKLKGREKKGLGLLFGKLVLSPLVLFTPPPILKDHTVLRTKGGGEGRGLLQKT